MEPPEWLKIWWTIESDWSETAVTEPVRLEPVGPDNAGVGRPRPRRSWRDLSRETVLLLPNLAKLMGRLVRDPRVPITRKVLAALVLAYVVSPIDIIPDFFLGVGLLDDIVLVALALANLMESAGPEVVLEHWDGSEDALDLVLATVDWGAEIIPDPVRRLLP